MYWEWEDRELDDVGCDEGISSLALARRSWEWSVFLIWGWILRQRGRTHARARNVRDDLRNRKGFF